MERESHWSAPEQSYNGKRISLVGNRTALREIKPPWLAHEQSWRKQNLTGRLQDYPNGKEISLVWARTVLRKQNLIGRYQNRTDEKKIVTSEQFWRWRQDLIGWGMKSLMETERHWSEPELFWQKQYLIGWRKRTSLAGTKKVLRNKPSLIGIRIVLMDMKS